MVPEYVKICLDTLHRGGHAAHPVGGCVRDTLLGRKPGDWDVTTSARPEQVMALFSHTVPTGAHHGTVTVVLEGGTVEVTTFRREEGYADGRHPDMVCFDVGLTEDLARRDFTVNAMAFGAAGEVIDPFGGQEDLKKGVIRAVGDPRRRFREDALRILRAIRFAARLGFVIEPETASAMEEETARLACVSAERVVSELEKTLLSAAPEQVGEFFRLGAMERFGCSCRQADWKALSLLPAEGDFRWRELCALTGLDITALPVSRRLRRAVLSPYAGMEKNLALSGGDLYALGLRGKQIGAMQKRLLAYVLEHPEENRKENLMEIMKKSAE